MPVIVTVLDGEEKKKENKSEIIVDLIFLIGDGQTKKLLQCDRNISKTTPNNFAFFLIVFKISG